MTLPTLTRGTDIAMGNQETIALVVSAFALSTFYNTDIYGMSFIFFLALHLSVVLKKTDLP